MLGSQLAAIIQLNLFLGGIPQTPPQKGMICSGLSTMPKKAKHVVVLQILGDAPGETPVPNTTLACYVCWCCASSTVHSVG